MADMIVINISCEGDNEASEIYKLHRQTQWVDLEAMLKAQFDFENMGVYYIDSESDYITMSSQQELEEAIKVAEKCHNTLHLKVRNLGSQSEEAPPQQRIVTDSIPVNDENTELKMAPIPEMSRREDGLAPSSQPDVIRKSTEENTPKQTEVLQVTIDRTTGSREISAPSRQKKKRDQTDDDIPRSEHDDALVAPVKRSKKRHARDSEKYRQCRSAERASRYCHVDSDSGELAEEKEAMPYPAFIKYMEELKKELRAEIVKDVTRKTVKQVLKGLDGAVIQSMKGTDGAGSPSSVTDTIPKSVKKRQSSDPNSCHPTYYHCGVICDFCEKNIFGARYKCCNCADYDLCEECENINGVHDPTHVFIKLRKPIKIQKKSPLMKQILYKPYRIPSSSEESAEKSEHQEQTEVTDEENKFGEKILAKIKKVQDKISMKQEKLLKKEEKTIKKLKQKLEVYKDMKASFVCDITIPDGTKVQPGTKFVKTWKMRNSGEMPWRDSTSLENVSGSIPTPFPNVSVPHLKPGETCEISVTFTAPEEPGKYQSHWKMSDSGRQFGHRVWCLVTVEPKLMLEPTKTDDSLKIIQEEKTENDVSEKEKATKSVVTGEVLLQPQETKESEFVIEKSPIQVEKDKDIETEILNETVDTEGQTEDLPCETVLKLEQELSTAAAAMAQLQLDSQQKQAVSEETGQDLMSFEMMDLATRGSNKMSQTATPNNTPLVVSPPKSPVPEESLSRASSVELLNHEQTDEEPVMVENNFAQNYMNSLPTPKPEAFYSSDDDSFSEDDDFLIIPMPACFDYNKPLSKSTVVESSSDTEERMIDDNHNTVDDTQNTTTDNNHNTVVQTDEPPTVDDILTASNSVATPTLDPFVPSPEPIMTETDPTSNVTAMVVPEVQTIPAEGEMADERQTKQQVDIGASGNLEIPPTNTETGEVSATNTSIQGLTDSPSETTEVKEALPEGDLCTGGAVQDDKGSKAEGQEQEIPVAGELVNQMMSTAVKAANRAAANAYTTCKEVFYTWQARTYQNGSGKDGKDSYKVPKSSWKPRAEKWKPKEEKWEPPSSKDSGPMKKLIEMGFGNRKKNQELLEKHDFNMEAVLAELLHLSENDWMHRRH